MDCFSPEQMVVGAPVTGTALVSSPLNKELSSFSLESDGVSRGALGEGWGRAGNTQKIENKNDLCKSSFGKPAFLVACIYNIKGGKYK